MRIAVNAIFLQENNLEGYGYFVQEIFKRLSIQYPEHQFYFLFDRAYSNIFIFSENIIPIVIAPKARHFFAFKFWYDWALPLQLSKIKPDIVVQPYGFCSLTTKYKQLLVLHDLSFIHYPQFIKKLHRFYYQLFTKKFVQKATRIATVSQFSKQDIITQYAINPNKIDVVYSAAKTVFKPLDFIDKQSVKDSFADGREYFLFTGGSNPRKNLITVLKAFSIFKKKLKSNMKLLIVGKINVKKNSIIEKLETYKYKEDVVLLNYVEDTVLVKLTASAYTCIYPSFFEGFGVPIVEAMQSGVPIITSNTSSMIEVGSMAALYTDPSNVEELANQMMMLYKDEKLRVAQIEKGLLQAKQFSWNNTAELLWQSILITVNK